MDYESLVEKNVNHMMEKMFGEKDPALKTITKMNILYDGTDDTKNDIENVLTKMKKMNALEALCIKNELHLSYDNEGNISYFSGEETSPKSKKQKGVSLGAVPPMIVSIYDIKDETENIFCEESKSEQDTEFRPSNR